MSCPASACRIAAWTLIDFDKPQPGLLSRFDWLGLAGMASFLGSLEYVLEEGTRLDWFQSHEIVFFTVRHGRSAPCCSSGGR